MKQTGCFPATLRTADAVPQSVTALGVSRSMPGLGTSSGDGAREVPPLARDTCLWQSQCPSRAAQGGRISPPSIIIFPSGAGEQA